MIAVLDTNVIVSALMIASSMPGLVLERLWSGAFTAVSSEPLMTELSSVMKRPRIRQRLGWTDREAERLIIRLRARITVVDPRIAVSIVERDPDDNRVLEAAIAGNAEFVVTGDLDLLELGSYEGIEIVTPRRFLAILDERQLL